MAIRHFHFARRITKVVQLSFGPSHIPLAVTISLEDGERLMAELANILREAAQLPSIEPNYIALAIRGELDTETRVIRRIAGIQSVPHADPTQPTILQLAAGTATGPMTVRITQIAAQELTTELNVHELTRGSA